jgi:hypothetical protein
MLLMPTLSTAAAAASNSTNTTGISLVVLSAERSSGKDIKSSGSAFKGELRLRSDVVSIYCQIDSHVQDKLIDMHSVQLFRTSINFVFELKYNFRALILLQRLL